MESDGSLTPSRSQQSFARNYNDGIGQRSAANELAILGETDVGPDEVQVAALARPAPLPRADVLAAIEATALRYAGHPGLRRTELSVRDWLTLYRANIEVESAYAHAWRQRCRDWAAIPDYAEGDKIKLASPLTLSDGSTCQIVTAAHYRRGRQKRRCYRIKETGSLVRLSKASLAGSKLISREIAGGSAVLAEFFGIQ